MVCGFESIAGFAGLFLCASVACMGAGIYYGIKKRKELYKNKNENGENKKLLIA